MNCPNCTREIVEDFYCIGCGHLPVWDRETPIQDEIVRPEGISLSRIGIPEGVDNG